MSDEQEKTEQPKKRRRFPKDWSGLKLKQKKLLEQLVKSLGVVQNACRIARVARSTYYLWMKEEQFNACAETILWHAVGTAEMKLAAKVMNGDGSAIQFYLRCRAPDRWSDRTKVEAEVTDRRQTSFDEKTDDELRAIIAAGVEGREADIESGKKDEE